jgi:hypothetical protein
MLSSDPGRDALLFLEIAHIGGVANMKTLIKIMIPLGLVALSGCVVVPARPYHYGYGPRVVVAPPPVVVVRP